MAQLAFIFVLTLMKTQYPDEWHNFCLSVTISDGIAWVMRVFFQMYNRATLLKKYLHSWISVYVPKKYFWSIDIIDNDRIPMLKFCVLPQKSLIEAR